MKAGVVYPQIELGGDAGAVKAFAQASEDQQDLLFGKALPEAHARSGAELNTGESPTQPEKRPRKASWLGSSVGHTNEVSAYEQRLHHFCGWIQAQHLDSVGCGHHLIGHCPTKDCSRAQSTGYRRDNRLSIF